ncbi:MAG TPA: ester cyclase [Bryobacteraceae bacterium]|nr:ester cyclase [Bryobacteraceae bacterium]
MSLKSEFTTTATRLRIVDDHIRFECAHELDSLIGTFGSEPEWHNRAADEVLNGHHLIRGFYSDLFRGFPDFWLDVEQRRVAQDAVVVEGMLGGTHTGEWMGIQPTRKPVAIPFCAIFTFDGDDRLKSEIVYYDRLALLSQLGVINLPG